MCDAERRQSVEHCVHDRRRRADRAALADPFETLQSATAFCSRNFTYQPPGEINASMPPYAGDPRYMPTG
jgi:hypothetical protein